MQGLDLDRMLSQLKQERCGLNLLFISFYLDACIALLFAFVSRLVRDRMILAFCIVCLCFMLTPF